MEAKINIKVQPSSQNSPGLIRRLSRPICNYFKWRHNLTFLFKMYTHLGEVTYSFKFTRRYRRLTVDPFLRAGFKRGKMMGLKRKREKENKWQETGLKQESESPSERSQS